MISICIPIYNYNVVDLVQRIHSQCTHENIPFEILLCDDVSTHLPTRKENQTLSQMDKVFYHENSTNIGNARNRMALAQKAQYEWLLFLDADVLPVHEDFISNYVKEIKQHKYQVIGGDIQYKNESQKDFPLKWLHGTQKECLPENYDQNSPTDLRGANFLIQKKIFLTNYFIALPCTYGYVDTALGINLKNHKIPMKIIHNPVYHLGLESAESFIQKQHSALKNALFLYENHPSIAKEIKLLSFYQFIKKVRLTGIVGRGFTLFQTVLKKNLLSSSPSLSAFQLYKLGYLCALASSKTESKTSS